MISDQNFIKSIHFEKKPTFFAANSIILDFSVMKTRRSTQRSTL